MTVKIPLNGLFVALADDTLMNYAVGCDYTHAAWPHSRLLLPKELQKFTQSTIHRAACH